MELTAEEIPFVSVAWFACAGFSCFLVLFAGIMSLRLVELEILQRIGTDTEKKQAAAAILPVVQKQHQLLVTLLLCNDASMAALPLYLDTRFNQYVAIILLVTFVLAFGEVIPQAICTRYGLAVGANFLWLVRVLVIVFYPIAYLVGKVLDYVLGHHEALFRRAQMKALVSIHIKEADKGGKLTHAKTTIISGALDLTEMSGKQWGSFLHGVMAEFLYIRGPRGILSAFCWLKVFTPCDPKQRPQLVLSVSFRRSPRIRVVTVASSLGDSTQIREPFHLTRAESKATNAQRKPSDSKTNPAKQATRDFESSI